MTDIENSMTIGPVAEYEGEYSDQELADRKANMAEELLNGDVLSLYLEAPILELQGRCIQEAVRKALDTEIGNYVLRAFTRDFRTDDANFAVWVDMCIRGYLPDYCLGMSAFEIQRSIYSVIDCEIERIVEGKYQ